MAVNLAKLLITQPRFARLCENLTYWCVMDPKVAEMLTFTCGQIQDGERPQLFNV